MFLARNIKKKSTERISMNPGKRMGHGPENNPLKFSSDLYKDTEIYFLHFFFLKTIVRNCSLGLFFLDFPYYFVFIVLAILFKKHNGVPELNSKVFA